MGTMAGSTLPAKRPKFLPAPESIFLLQENHKITTTMREKAGDDCLAPGGKAECSQLPGFGQ
ncbi:MAG: hypothetical protein NDI91_07675 [Sulfuritalea sp.]|nr:hypothetical protein [Sulfuritalea sp.]